MEDSPVMTLCHIVSLNWKLDISKATVMQWIYFIHIFLNSVCLFRTHSVAGFCRNLLHCCAGWMKNKCWLLFLLAVLQSHIVLLNCDVCSSFPLPDMLGRLPSN